MGLYVKDEDVRVRLVGKVRFTEDEADENKMHIKLLRRLIDEAEGDVEHDLSPRYAAPFQTAAGTPFDKLPARPTKEMLRTLCELKAVIRVLETDFGRGSVSDADKYTEKLEKRYKAMLEKLIQRRADGQKGWVYPPLPDLKLNYFNTEADDGFSGMVLTTSMGDGGYPSKQINDPSENWWNGGLDE